MSTRAAGIAIGLAVAVLLVTVGCSIIREDDAAPEAEAEPAATVTLMKDTELDGGRIEFDAGHSRGRVTGSVPVGGSDTFVFGASGGQRIVLSTGKDVEFRLIAPDGTRLATWATRYEGLLTQDGDYSVIVTPCVDEEVGYELDMTIPG